MDLHDTAHKPDTFRDHATDMIEQVRRTGAPPR